MKILMRLRYKERNGGKMNWYAEGTFSILFQIISMISTHQWNHQRRFGMLWRQSTKLRKYVRISLLFKSILIIKCLIMSQFWIKCMSYRFWSINSVICQSIFLNHSKWVQSLQNSHQIGIILGRSFCICRKISF